MMKQVLVLDASQISAFSECNELWNLSYRRRRTKETAIDQAVTYGTFGHKLLEVYYQNIHLGVNVAVKAALEFNIDTHDKADNGHFPLSPEGRKKVLVRFGDYWMKYHNKDVELIRRQVKKIIVHPETQLFTDIVVNEPIIEKGFSYSLLDTSEYLFILEGKIDMIAKTPLGISFIDHKFQLTRSELYTKSIQFKSYALATGLFSGLINYIRLKDKLDEDCLVRQPISFNSQEMKYWKQELIGIFIDIAKSIRLNKFKHNWDSCRGRYRRFCEYTSVCEEHNQLLRESIIQINFKPKKEWKPW